MIERDKLISMVRGLQNGDPDASNLLFDTIQSDIYYFVLKTVNNDHHLAEDLTQDTMVTILEKIDSLQEPAAFVTWSKEIAYHKCTDQFKKKKELLVDENEDGYSVFDTIEEENTEFLPDAALDKEDLRKTILAMINDLPEDQKSAIILRYFNEISVKEIATIQGVSEGTVKSRLNYGRKAIKQSVEEYEKKNDVKLHCAGIIPLLLWFFRWYRINNDLSITSNTAMQTFVLEESTAAAVAASGSATATAATASSTVTAATVETAAGVGAKVAGKVVLAKVAAILVAATITVGSVVAGVSMADDSQNTEPTHTETQEAWTTEATVYDEAEESSIATEEASETMENPTESVTEAHTESTEYETIPTTDPPVSTENPKESETEPSVEETTETTTEADACEHSWSIQTEISPETIYEYNVCDKCGYFEIKDQYPNPCEHNWVQSTEVRPDEIVVFTNCSVCGICANIEKSPNPCQHDWYTYIDDSDPMWVIEYYECLICGLKYWAYI